MSFNWFELAFVAGILVCAVFAGRTERNEPYRVKMCLVASGPEGEDVSTDVWSDYVERYLERYPGSYCGSCGKERACPE